MDKTEIKNALKEMFEGGEIEILVDRAYSFDRYVNVLVLIDGEAVYVYKSNLFE